MPTYEFRDNETGETFEKRMSILDLDKYKEDNPNLEQYHSTYPGLVADAHVRDKRPDGFKDVLKSIKKANPGSTIDTNFTSNI